MPAAGRGMQMLRSPDRRERRKAEIELEFTNEFVVRIVGGAQVRFGWSRRFR